MTRYLFILLTIIGTTLINAQDKNNNTIVLELFTSQGCSSCPPADELLETIKEEYYGQNVFVLSYHVDYWNRLGWKDPFSSEMFSDYQREYAQQFYSNSIYTPQLVVNGSEHFTGSNEAKTRVALRKYVDSDIKHKIKIQDLKKTDGGIVFNYSITGEVLDRVTFVLVVAEKVTKISKGENRNRTLRNSNIVANRIVTTIASDTIRLQIPDWINKKDKLSVVAYTQNAALKTTGATKKDI